MSDDQLYQSVGRIEGKVDSLIETVKTHIALNDAAHLAIDGHIACIKQDINQAKGAKGAIMWASGGVAAAVAAVWHALDRVIK